MPDRAHVDKIREGVKAWNLWRSENPHVTPDLSQANLRGATLTKADLSRTALWQTMLSGADLAEANLAGADLYRTELSFANLQDARLTEAYLVSADMIRANLTAADLTQANLVHADLHGAELRGADLDSADLTEANLFGVLAEKADFHAANLIRADLADANLAGSNLTEARLVGTILKRTDLAGCWVYGTSVWKVNLEGTTQTDLVVTPGDEPEVTVDELEVAQLVYLLLDNEKVRNFIDSLTSKAVLILETFSPPERKQVLDAIKRRLREKGYAPILFDVDGPESRDTTTAVTTLAHLSRFVVADLTMPRSSPYEVGSFARDVAVPIRPLVQEGHKEFGMFADLQRPAGSSNRPRKSSIVNAYATIATARTDQANHKLCGGVFSSSGGLGGELPAPCWPSLSMGDVVLSGVCTTFVLLHSGKLSLPSGTSAIGEHAAMKSR